MILLTNTNHSLEMELGFAVSTDWAVSYADNTTTTFTPGSSQGNASAAGTTQIVPPPAASTQRQVKLITVRNRGGSDQTVVIKKDVGGTEYYLSPTVTLASGETLQYVEGSGFSVLDPTGQVKAGVQVDASTFIEGVGLITVIGGTFNDAMADLAAGTAGAPRLTAKRSLHVTLFDSIDGLPIGEDPTDPLYSQITSIEDYVNPGIGKLNLGKADGATWVVNSVGVMALGTQGDGTGDYGYLNGQYLPITLDSHGRALVAGQAPDGNAIEGNPLVTGVEARSTNRLPVVDASVVRNMGDDVGRQVMLLNHVRDLVTQAAPLTLTNTTETTILAAGGAGVFHDVTHIVLTNTSATSVRVDFRDATAGAVRMSISLSANGGAVVPFPVPLKQTTANNNWTAQLSTAVTDVRIFLQAVKNV